MNEIIEKIAKTGIVPVIALDNVSASKPLAKALCDGGIACAEITFRTEAAEETIRIMAKEFPGMLIGAGTVLNKEQVDRAIDAGASFVVSPGLNPRVVEYCISKGVTIIPGCSNPSDIEAAIELGLDVVKFFPAEAAGGINMIKAMSAPYSNMRFMPTGGINEKNMKNYFAFPKVIACGGSWMVNKEMIEAGDFNTIKALTKQAVNSMLGFEIIPAEVVNRDKEAAEENSQDFEALFGISSDKDGLSLLNGIDKIKNVSSDHPECITIGTYSMERAMYHLSQRGIEFDLNSIKYDKNDKISTVELINRIDGFSVRLTVRK